MKRSDPALLTMRRLRRKMIGETAAIVIGAVCMFELVDYGTHVLMNLRANNPYDPIDGIGMILPMSLIVGLLYRRNLRNYNRYVSQLVKAVNRIASGDFGVVLDPKKGGPFRDVFENFNKMSRELDSVQTLRDDFVNRFSHEFKTPIASINGFVRLLQESRLSPEKSMEYLGIIDRESRRLARLADSTLLMVKLETQELVREREVFSLDEQIRECVILLAPEWSRKNLDLEGDLESISHRGNREIMSQLWINLLSNGIGYSPEGAPLRLALVRRKGEIVFSLQDRGPGIPPEERERIFRKYYRGDGNDRQGLGLGLAIADQIVRLCGGRIEVESRPGEGSLFSVFLPE